MITTSTYRTARSQEIHEAAAKLFSNLGYGATSMRALAKEVGVEVSSLYSHISSKQELLSTICSESAELFSDGLDIILAQDLSTVEQLAQVIQLHISIALQYPSSLVVFNDEWKHLEKIELKEFIESRKKYEGHIQRILEAGMQEGALITAPVHMIKEILFSSLKWIYRYADKKQQRSYDMNEEKMRKYIPEIILQGIKKSS